jgi:hypothetical protein
MGDAAMEPPKEDFSVGPLSVLSESVKKNCQVLFPPLPALPAAPAASALAGAGFEAGGSRRARVAQQRAGEGSRGRRRPNAPLAGHP